MSSVGPLVTDELNQVSYLTWHTSPLHTLLHVLTERKCNAPNVTRSLGVLVNSQHLCSENLNFSFKTKCMWPELPAVAICWWTNWWCCGLRSVCPGWSDVAEKEPAPKLLQGTVDPKKETTPANPKTNHTCINRIYPKTVVQCVYFCDHAILKQILIRQWEVERPKCCRLEIRAPPQ